MVVDSIETGLAQGVDYCGAAISGMELISADIVTAAMFGQTIPIEPLSRWAIFYALFQKEIAIAWTKKAFAQKKCKIFVPAFSLFFTVCL